VKIKHVKMQNPSLKVDVKILKINWRMSRPTKEIGTKVIDHIITTTSRSSCIIIGSNNL